MAGLLSNYGYGLPTTPVRRKAFISYYHGDQAYVDQFVADFERAGVFIPRMLGRLADDVVNSTSPDYVMNQIRQRYLKDSTVTIVLIGHCTHSRRYVDWEIKSSLRQGSYTPNGLLGILLPYMGARGYLPDRLAANWESGETNCYARYRPYPQSAAQLAGWLEDAVQARTTRAHLIINSQSMMKYNQKCRTCGVTH